MANIYQNITGSTATKVNSIVRNSNLNCMKLCNVHASDAVVLDLYITYTERDKSDGRKNIGDNGNWNDIATITKTYYILKNSSMPKGVTLVLDNKDLSFDTKRYDLYIKLDQSDSAVDIIVDTEIVQTNKINRSTSRGSSELGGY